MNSKKKIREFVLLEKSTPRKKPESNCHFMSVSLSSLKQNKEKKKRFITAPLRMPP